MRCPFCGHAESQVKDSRPSEDNAAIRRRRFCTECGGRFTTVEEVQLLVLKSNGVTERFSRGKVEAGVRKACQGRPVRDGDIAALAQRVEESIRALGRAEIASGDVGLAVLPHLHDLDEVAYLRFASVYRAFSSIEDFEREITLLRLERHHEVTPADAPPGESIDHPLATLHG